MVHRVNELDPAQWWLSLRDDRMVARRQIALGLGVLASSIATIIVGSLTNTTMLILATFFGSMAIPIGGRAVWKGVARLAVASYKLRSLERGTNLPPARLVD